MDNTYLNIFIAAAVGSIFTLLVQASFYFVRNYRIKRAFKSFLNDTIKVTCELIKDEIDVVKKEISAYGYNDVSLGMHPNLNSRVLKSFPIDRLYSVYGNKVNRIIDIISILDNLESRKPYIYFNDFIKITEDHIEEIPAEEKDIFKDKDDHFQRCQYIKTLRRRTKTNLDHVKETIDELYENIEEL